MRMINRNPAEYADFISSVILGIEKKTGKYISYFTLKNEETEDRMEFNAVITFNNPAISQPMLTRLIEEHGMSEGIRRYSTGEYDATRLE